MYRPHTTQTLWGLRFLLLFGLVTIHPLSRLLPTSHGWENGIFENAQIMVLLTAGLCAAFWAWNAKHMRLRWFWCMITPIWFILALRELSWGAALLDPIFFSFETGPEYPSSRTMSARNFIVGTAAAALLGSVLIFVLTRQYRRLAWLWQRKSIPVLELTFALLATALVVAAENRLQLEPILLLSHSQGQLMEEIAEFWVYSSLAVAQWHVFLTDLTTQPAGSFDLLHPRAGS